MKLKPVKSPAKSVVNAMSVVEKLNLAFSQAASRFVSRDEVMSVIKLAIICKDHVMLDGKHGVAKSEVAEAAFGVFEPKQLPLYVRQFSSGTLPEEIYGPLSIAEFKAGRIEFNTEGMLPEAALAFLDEVYRGPKTILSTMMGMMNERKFVNGPVVMKCPLITAVGTTNFVTDDPELDAYHDRWLFRINVPRLGNIIDRMKLLMLVDQPAKVESELITASELASIHNDLLPKVVVPDSVKWSLLEVCKMYEAEMLAKAGEAASYISDRRLVKVQRVCKAVALTQGRMEVSVDDFLSVKHALYTTGTSDSHSIFAEKVIHQSSLFSNHSVEMASLDKMLSGIQRVAMKYEQGVYASTADKAYVRTGLQSCLSTAGIDEEFKVPYFQHQLRVSVELAKSIHSRLSSDLGLKPDDTTSVTEEDPVDSIEDNESNLSVEQADKLSNTKKRK